MEAPRAAKHLALILAREFASELAVPMLVSDADGRLVFFNEAAEEVLGQSFAETGELPAQRWASTFAVTDEEGTPVELEEMPGGVALLQQKPAHGTLAIVGLDEIRRTIEVTAIPLLARRDESVGVIAIFWPVQ